MGKITEYATTISALGGCWAFVFNPKGILDVVNNTWPTFGTWLPFIGLVAAVLFGIVVSVQVIRDWLSIRARRLYEETERVLDSLNSLQELFEYDTDNRDEARIQPILMKLTQDGILPQGPGAIQTGEEQKYFVSLEETIKQFGLRYVKSNKVALAEPYKADPWKLK